LLKTNIQHSNRPFSTASKQQQICLSLTRQRQTGVNVVAFVVVNDDVAVAACQCVDSNVTCRRVAPSITTPSTPVSLSYKLTQ